MGALMTDLWSAIRALRSARGFTAVAVFTLSAGLALAVGVLTVLHAYIVRGLPFPESDRFYRVDYAPPNQPPPRGLAGLDWRALDDIVELPVAWDLDVFYLLGQDYPESLPGAWVTPGYLPAFGIRATIGRTFVDDDYAAASAPVALISHRLWQTRFRSDPSIVGQTFPAYVSDRPDEPELFTIVGVLPADLWHLNAYTEVLAPLKAASYPYMVRLRPAVPAATAADRITQLVRDGASAVPEDFGARLTSVSESYTLAIRPVLWAVTVTAALVLLIAGANVAVLMLVRGRRRQKELAVRLALGASHARLARLLIVEGFVIGAVSTAAGIAIGYGAAGGIGPFVERFFDRRIPGGLEQFSVDAPVVAAAVLCGFLVTIIFTLAPLAATWRASLAPNLTLTGRSTTDAAGSGRSRAVLIGLEVAASMTLLIGAALMAETAIRMLRVDFGVDARGVVTSSLALRQRTYPDEASRAAFFDRLSTRLSSVPGTRGMALGDWWPLQSPQPRRLETAGSAPRSGSGGLFGVSPDYFTTLGMTFRDGRTFTADDRLGAAPVAIVSAFAARQLWPGEAAVGQRLTIHPASSQMPDPAAGPLPVEVVGVVNDVRQSHTDQDLVDVYLPLAQRPGRFAFLYVRGSGGASWESDLRTAVASVDREVALGTPRSLDAGIEQERARPRFLAYLLGIFALIACGLALIGMHGVIAYTVRQRQREIAVRVALGADGHSVTRLFLRQGLVVLAGGVVSGLAGAVALGRVLESQLHGVQAAEPRILAGAAAVFAACGLAAIWWPASQAASTDPALVLKEE